VRQLGAAPGRPERVTDQFARFGVRILTLGQEL
jgi:hypothetical protein